MKIRIKLSDELPTLALISSSPESWNTSVVTLSNSALAKKVIIDTVVDTLLNEEARTKERGISMQSEANFTDNHGRRENHMRNLNLSLN